MERDAVFDSERRENWLRMESDEQLRADLRSVFARLNSHRHSYSFDWLGLPIIQYPPDIVAIQELIWRVRPEVIVETGVARGGSLALSSSVLEMLGGDGFVVGVEVDLHDRNRCALEAHVLSHRIKIVDGSSVNSSTIAAVHELVGDRSPVMVFLDSNHTYEHVAAELEAYSPLVTSGSYVVVFDTVVDFLPEDSFSNRPWAPGNSPKTAVDEFLARPGCRFAVDEEYNAKLALTVAPGGYLRCIS